MAPDDEKDQDIYESKRGREMALLETLSSTELLNLIIYDNISATCDAATPPTPYTFTSSSHESNSGDPYHSVMKPPQCPRQDSQAEAGHQDGEFISTIKRRKSSSNTTSSSSLGAGVCNSKKKRKRARVCKNKEEAETQRMTHITVERNRRKQMNEHLAVLRSLMPDSYAQRGDQASIVGGAIEFVKELEHMLQSLEAQKLQPLEQQGGEGNNSNDEDSTSSSKLMQPPFAQFFMYPQYTWSQIPNKFTSKTKAAAIADIEVTLIETHASLRILSRRSLRQLSKLVAGFHALHLTILHLTVTTVDPLVLYSISAKVEEGCQLSSVDDIAAAMHHMLRIIEEEACMLLN